MKYFIKMRSIRVLWVILFSVLLTGCSFLKTPVKRGDEKAFFILDRLANKNIAPEGFKGIGTLRMMRGGLKETYRAVWAGDVPGKRIRIELLDILGKPVIGLASNGRYVYFLSHSPRQFIKTGNTRRALERYISIPVSFEEVLYILTGRILNKKFHHVIYEENYEKDMSKISFMDKRNTPIQILYIEASSLELKKADILDRYGNFTYGVRFDRMQKSGECSFPKEVTIFDSENTITLIFSRYQVDPDFDSDLFMLTP